MNRVALIGRITKDLELRFTQTQMAVCRFTLAVDRKKKDSGTDFITCTAFGKVAEILQKYVRKGHLLGITGHIQTGSYEKNGQKTYTVDVIVEEFDFLQARDRSNEYEDPYGFEQTDLPY